LVLYLLLALPFQAYAAASMRPLVAPRQLPPCHQQMAGGHMTMSAASMADDKHTGQHDGQHDKHKAGACPACCVGPALASAVPLPPAPASPRFVSIPFRAGYLPSVDPVLPERPPSTLST
jgi:hypothetical protein